MIRNDLSLWPLVLSASRGTPTYEELQFFSAEWESWLDRGERFATLRVYLDAASHTHPEGGAKEKKRWFQANGPRLKSLVIGMASVVPSGLLDEVRRMNAEKLYGVPAQTFDQVDEALAWIGRLLAEMNIELRPNTVRERLAALTLSV